ncbi:MAG: indolepyruvate oxidoreductase subunit beta family protein, partial [Paracoccaceae bacterium]|nr:indolepyruvate oxidoreductase subunit beta family protein [Paracoccaceae bacterium]
SEKMAPGDGIANADEVRAAAQIAAQRLILADLEGLAVAEGSVISASLLGALAGSGALPFPRDAFEAAIRAGNNGVAPSLRAFAAGYQAARGRTSASAEPASAPKTLVVHGPSAQLRDWQRLTDRIAAFPAPVQAMALHGLRKVVTFQDIAYGADYLDHLNGILALDDSARGYVLTTEAAKYIANAMAYDDIIRVADLKTRAGRFARVRAEMGAQNDTVMQITEFMHPRAMEVVGMLPARFGAWLDANGKWMARIDRLVNKGRRLRSDSLTSFIQLYLIASLRRWRRGNLRHAIEVAHMAHWLDLVRETAPVNPDLAVELLRCRRLVKGYSDTHARGLSRFDHVLDGIALVKNRPDAAAWARRLREAALQDEDGKALDGAILTVKSF